MTDKPAEGAGEDRPEDGISKDFSELTPEQFLDKTADNEATEPPAGADHDADADEASADPVDELKALVAERTGDLQRLQAEYVNYKRRVDRDRDLARNRGIESVVRDLVPVFDAIDQASAHGELTGGFKLVADELGRLAAKHGLSLYGEAGEEFDPRRHEALMQVPVPGEGEMLIHEVMQKGVELNGVEVRPARVVVSVPNGDQAGGESAEGGQAPQGTGEAAGQQDEEPEDQPGTPHDDTAAGPGTTSN